MVVTKDKEDSEHAAQVVSAKQKMEVESQEVAENSLNLLSPRSVSPRKSPVTVQQWVDSLSLEENERREEEMPSETEVANVDAEVENLTLGAEAAALCRPCPVVQITECGSGSGWAGASSDAGSHCSSMDSLLEARKPNPEELLLELGFGSTDTPDVLSRIPARFLQPSHMKGVQIDDFLKHQQKLADTFESGFSGYMGLQGPSHSMPSGIVGKIMERLVDRGGGGGGGVALPPHTRQRHRTSSASSPRLAKVAHNLLNRLRVVRESVLSSPDNRRWMENQGDRSPEPPRGRRLIIGKRSFSLSKDGDIIESPNRSKSTSPILISNLEIGKDEDEEEKQDETKSEAEETENGNNNNRDPTSAQLELEFKSISLLAAQLKDFDVPSIGTKEHFMGLTAEERRSLEVGLIEQALAVYEKRLKEFDIRSHLEELLTGQLTDVTQLLDTSTSLPSLHTVVTQMTKLLRHQDSLREELKVHKTRVSQSVGF